MGRPLHGAGIPLQLERAELCNARRFFEALFAFAHFELGVFHRRDIDRIEHMERAFAVGAAQRETAHHEPGCAEGMRKTDRFVGRHAPRAIEKDVERALHGFAARGRGRNAEQIFAGRIDGNHEPFTVQNHSGGRH